MTTAGLPAAKELEGIDLVTTLEAAIIEFFPTVTPGRITQFSPIHTLSSIFTGPFENKGRFLGDIFNSDGLMFPCE